MKRIITLVAIVVMSFNARAERGTLINWLPYSITGVFDNVWLTGSGGGGWSGSAPIIIPVYWNTINVPYDK